MSYIKSEGLFTKKDKILIAVSGGMDSITLTELMRISQFKFAIAHFNHCTRNGESDKDELFVANYARERSIPFYSTSMDIHEIIREKNGGNFQNLARLYRYEWLSELRKELDYDYIATAHHHNDQIETFLFHFSRGTGLDGLTGIASKQEFLVRPMLVFTRQEIEEYVFKNKIEYRVDSSNANSKYSRNYIRHGIIPSFKILNEQFEANANKTIENLRSAKMLYDHMLAKFSQKSMVRKESNVYELSKSMFEEFPENIVSQLCFELIRKFGFNYSQAKQIINASSQRGKTFFSDEYTLLIEKDILLIRKTISTSEVYHEVQSDCEIPGFGRLTIRETELGDITRGNPNVEFVDGDKLDFPLHIRNKKDGDRFKPIGMKGKSKKLKDFFTDLKLNKFEKDRVLVLMNNSKVVWVMGLRLSEKFKITQDTRKILRLEWQPSNE